MSRDDAPNLKEVDCCDYCQYGLPEEYPSELVWCDKHLFVSKPYFHCDDYK